MTLSSIQHQQEIQLNRLLQKALLTEYGKLHQFSKISSYEEFSANVPIVSYSDIESYINRIKLGESDVLWPGQMNQFAVSSGTTGKGKHLPISKERLLSDLRFLRSVSTSMISGSSHPLQLLGYHLSIPGSLEYVQHQNRRLEMGEISGFLAKNAPWWTTLFQLIPPQELIQLPWDSKYERILSQASKVDLRAISGVPTWLWKLFNDILELTGKNTISEVWPHLSHVFTGGVALQGYKAALDDLIGHTETNYLESYGASEGYIAHNPYPNADSLQLVLNNGLFYEFEHVESKQLFLAHELKDGHKYSLIITNNAGLWRYRMNDVLQCVYASKSLIRVVGRVSLMLDKFGEAVHDHEIQEIRTKLQIKYPELIHLAVTYPKWDHSSAPHLLFYCFANSDKAIPHHLALDIDTLLQEINRHYAIRRASGAMSEPCCKQKDLEAISLLLKNKTAQAKLPSVILSE